MCGSPACRPFIQMSAATDLSSELARNVHPIIEVIVEIAAHA